MYQGNHDSRDQKNSSREKGTVRRRFRWRKEFVLVVSLLAMLVGIVGGTVAYLSAQTEPLANQFELAEVSSEIEEDFTGTVKENVTIKNTGDISVYIRAKVVVTWQDKNANVYGKTPVPGEDYTIEYDNSGWNQQGDYWYYNSPVAPENSTGILIQECKPVSDRAPEGYYLSVEILAEAIQSEPEQARQEAWNYSAPALSN